MSNRFHPGFIALCSLVSAAAIAASAEDRPDVEPIRSFVSDHRAFREGDVLTVLVIEAASATSATRTRTDKDESAGVALVRQPGTTRRGSAGWDVDFGGGGEVERSGRLLARITVRVMSVTPSGLLVVHGDQDIKVNAEKQHIVLSGTVRHDDIAADNTVPSWRLSDARIEFAGDGVLGRTQNPGPFARLLHWLGIN